jgi:hypothetical protein
VATRVYGEVVHLLGATKQGKTDKHFLKYAVGNLLPPAVLHLPQFYYFTMVYSNFESIYAQNS